MNLNFFMFIIFLLFLMAVGLVLYLIKLMTREKKKENRDIWVINPMTQYAGKSSMNKLKKIYRKGDWVAVLLYPRSKDIKKLQKEGKTLKPKPVFLPKDNLDWSTKGSWDEDCGVLTLLPIRERDMAEGLRGTALGMGLMIKSNESEHERFDDRIRTLRDKNIEGFAKDLKGLEIAKLREETMKQGLNNPDKQEPKK